MTEARLIEVETTLAFQEKTVGDLSEVICRQQQELDLLKKQVKELRERLEQAAEAAPPTPTHPTLAPPPNY